MYNQMYNYNNNYPMHYEIVHIQGEAGARSLLMAPNSNALLLDDTAPLVWLVQVDGNGNKTINAYDISLHQPEPTPDYNLLMQRLDKLEGMLNDKSNTTSVKRKQTESVEQ